VRHCDVARRRGAFANLAVAVDRRAVAVLPPVAPDRIGVRLPVFGVIALVAVDRIGVAVPQPVVPDRIGVRLPVFGVIALVAVDRIGVAVPQPAAPDPGVVRPLLYAAETLHYAAVLRPAGAADLHFDAAARDGPVVLAPDAVDPIGAAPRSVVVPGVGAR